LRGDPTARENALLRAVDVYGRVAPRDSGHGAALSNLGVLALTKQEPMAALGFLDRALRVALAAGPAAGSDLARISSRRGQVLLELGRLGEAHAAFTEARRLFSETLGLDHPTAWQATSGLAFVEHRLGNESTAERLLQSVADAPGYALPVNQGRRAEADAVRSRFLTETGRTAAAPAL
jgi:hypothetical protein